MVVSTANTTPVQPASSLPRASAAEQRGSAGVDSPDRRSARDRLLDAADELFYAEGVHSVGIDRVIARAGVAKASLYNTFGSKEELVRAYLTRRHEARQARVQRMLQRYDQPRERLLGVFDVLSELFSDTSFRGCAFLNASAEAPPDSAASQVCELSRGWLRELLTELAGNAGAADPAKLAQQLVLLYDGSTVSAQLDHNQGAASTARAVAAILLDAAIDAKGDSARD